MSGYEGFAALGDVLSGGANRRAAGAYDEGYTARANSAYAMERASKERALRLLEDMNIGGRQAGMEAYPAYVAAQGGLPELGALGAASIQQGGIANFDQFMGGHGKAADIEMNRQQLEALDRGDIQAAQRISAVQDNKVLPELGSGGNTVFTPLGGGVAMTALGDAEVGARNARAGASNASAQAALGRLGIAQAQFGLQRAGQWNPDGGSSGSGAGGKAPSGYRWGAGGRLEPIPGGPADKKGAGTKPLPAETRMKLGMLEAAELAAQRYATAVLPEGGGFNRSALHIGPAGGQIEEAINNVLRVESGAAVPDTEVAGGVRRYGATVINQEETARANLQQLNDKIRILRANVTGQTQGLPALGSLPAVGVPSVPSVAPLGAPRTVPSPRAIQALTTNPGMAAEFDAKYGAGASATYLAR